MVRVLVPVLLWGACAGPRTGTVDPAAAEQATELAISEFWAWFATQEAAAVSALERQREQQRPQQLIAMIVAADQRLDAVHPQVRAELGGAPGAWEIVITCDALPAAAPSVEKVVAAAPPLQQFRVVAFRPPLPGTGWTVEQGRVSMGRADVPVAAGVVAGKLRVSLMVDNPTNETVQAVAVRVLDSTLGERNSLGVDVLRVVAQDAPVPDGLERMTLDQLVDRFPALLAQRAGE